MVALASGGPVAQYEGLNSSRKDHICVAVRFRPLSDKERARGDHEVWECQGTAVGIKADVGMNVKFVYDHVFAPHADNPSVYRSIASPIVCSSLDGLNGTIFAYGVTSSGKTHTMMGDEGAPGIVPHAIAEVFRQVAKTPGKEFLLRMQMMEIYNEVLNDLLDPSRTNLRLREDPRRGVYVEGIKEETLISAEHALQVIAMGNENRKTSATAFNEGSSRSHTIIRISVEASDRADASAEGDDVHVGRTLSFLTLVDLAGSESAKAEVNRSQRMEGSFINKSLLTLGTVIHKLSEPGKAAHIPFRDSKLTRLLQNSLTGNGARIAVICTITPASTQAEETHNTLKFASRAKQIAITARRNEIMDQSSLIARYQQELGLLRRQLEVVMRERGGLPIHDPLHPEVRTLRERLEEEHAALAAREREKRTLEERVARLAACVLHGSAAASQLERRLGPVESGADEEELAEAAREAAGLALRHGPPPGPPPAPSADARVALRSVRAAGDLFVGVRVEAASAARRSATVAEVEADLLRRQVVALAQELVEQERLLASIRTMKDVDFAAGDGDDVALQVMLAEREFMQAQLAASDEHSGRLAGALERMRAQLAAARGVDPDSIDYGLDDVDAAAGGGEGAGGEAGGAGGGGGAGGAEGGAAPLRRGYDHVLAGKVLQLEEKVALAIDALRSKEEQINTQRRVLQKLTGLEGTVQGQLSEVDAENASLRRELERVEAQNSRLQGYALDALSNEDLSELIGGLTQAVERVRITVQLRRLAGAKRGGGASSMLRSDGSGGAGMTTEDMRAALAELSSAGNGVPRLHGLHDGPENGVHA